MAQDGYTRSTEFANGIAYYENPIKCGEFLSIFLRERR